MSDIQIKKVKKAAIDGEDWDTVNANMTVFTGHDKGLEYLETKKVITRAYDKIVKRLMNGSKFYSFNNELPKGESMEVRNNYMRSIYLMIAMIQLRNASRISEACAGFYRFIKEGFDKNILVKISKSEAIRYKNGKKYVTKARFRKMMFPSGWIKKKIPIEEISAALGSVKRKTMMKRVLDYVRNNHKINTHSLRYATINYLISEKKLPANIVSKYVGHSSLNTILTYTQTKQCDKIFDIDM